MDRMLIGFGVITLIGYLALGLIKPSSAASGLDFTAEMFLQSAPWIIVSMFAAGLISQFFNAEWIAHILGREAGFRGIVVGALLGLLGTGSRWAVYPLAAGLLAAEASPASVFAFLTTWQLVALPRLPAEVPFLGLKFTIIRAVMSLIVAVIGGMLINLAKL